MLNPPVLTQFLPHFVNATLIMLLVSSSQMIGQSAKQPAVQLRVLDKASIETRFEHLRRTDKSAQVMDRHLREMGFNPEKGPQHVWGMESVKEDEGKRITSSISIQDYTRPDSEDAVALAQVSIRGERANSYTFMLVATNKDFKRVNEYMVTRDFRVVPAHSMWSCITGQLGKVGQSCLISTGSCAPGLIGGFAAYGGCIALNCAAALGKAVLCCACDNWWACASIVGHCSSGDAMSGCTGVLCPKFDGSAECVPRSVGCPCKPAELKCYKANGEAYCQPKTKGCTSVDPHLMQK